MKQIHPFAEAIPRMSDEEMNDLRESMNKYGFFHTHPVILFEDMILDGRHRYEIALELGLSPRTMQYEGTDPGGYVLVTNVKARRNLTVGQKAMAAQGILEIAEERAKLRKAQAVGAPRGEKSSHVLNPTQETQEQGRSSEIVATQAGIGASSIKQAKIIKQKSPELAKEVASGKTSLNAAYTKVNPPKPRMNAETKAELSNQADIAKTSLEERRIPMLESRHGQETDTTGQFLTGPMNTMKQMEDACDKADKAKALVISILDVFAGNIMDDEVRDAVVSCLESVIEATNDVLAAINNPIDDNDLNELLRDGNEF